MIKNMRMICLGLALAGVCGAVGADAMAAAAKKTSKQSAIQKGTTVRTRVDAGGLYNQECYDAYYGCMDQFCIADNANGGSCSCSDDSIQYEKEYAEILKTVEEAERVATIEVEKVKAGANADIIFTGTREYDADGNVVKVDEVGKGSKREQRKRDLMAMFEQSNDDDDDDIWGENVDIMGKTGKALYTAAENICREQMPDACTDKDISFLRQVYVRQIAADCTAFKNTIATKRREADLAMAEAQADVRAAQKESFEAANKYDLGQCMVEFKKCMQTKDACGDGWENCVFTVATENMQNNKAKSTANTKVKTIDTYDITASTMEILSSKRIICERVLDSCVAVRDMVWPAFLREAAPTIRVAEQNVESKFRQSCLTKISDCIQTACKDDIVGKGVDTMDACLARPDMARSFCKVEIDPCERMEPQIWGYVTDKLAAMRVDACTQEVKDCFTDDTRCGADFSNCIGMDYDYIHDICPIDKLVVCKQTKANFSMDDLDSMLMGLYLNIDNSALDQCQQLVDAKMAEVCGSTTDCNKFAADEILGTGSIRSQKDGTIYRVTGMISFGSIKMGDSSGKTMDNGEDGSVKLGPGEIGVAEYIAKVKSMNTKSADAGIIASIEEELNNIAGTINRTIEMIEQDPKIQFCVSGRDLSQITGESGAKTSARFPNLLNQVKMQIAIAALRKAQDNYNKKLNDEISKATKDASADLAQYMCQKMAETGGSSTGSTAVDTALTAPYAISYDVGAGLTTDELKQGGAGVLNAGGVSFTNKGYLGGASMNGGGVTKTIRAVFNRETRTCHLCTQTSSEDCKTTGSSSWFHNSRNTSCETKVGEEQCEDIVM
ncbi:hypothetical protein HDR66_02610 [bacterium]|nr:hypothetical protein [bacterium]